MRELAFGRDTCWGFHSIMRFPPGWYWWRKQQPEQRRRGESTPEGHISQQTTNPRDSASEDAVLRPRGSVSSHLYEALTVSHPSHRGVEDMIL